MEHMVCLGDISNVYEVIEFVKGDAAGIEDELQLSRLELAVEEIFVNIAHYAYEDGKGEVEIQCYTEQNMLMIRFTDSGIPFDITEVPQPDITGSAEERPIGGLGIFLVREVMDYVHYEYKENKNILTIGMKLSDKHTQ